MSVAPSASSLSCSCLQAVRNGAVWAGVRRPALGRLCVHATRAPHRPEPAVAAGSRGEPQLPATSPQCPCDPAFPCSSHTAPPRLQGASRGTAESQARHTHTHTHARTLFGRLRLQVVQRMREAGEALRAQLELRRRRLALGLERDLGGGCRGRQGMQGDAGEMHAVSETLVGPGVRWSGGLMVWCAGI